jgi:PRTRC genetic system protein B
VKDGRALSFELVEEEAGSVTLECAVLIYGSGRASTGGSAFATVHGVQHDGKGAATILPGKPLTLVQAARLARRLSRPERGGFIAPTLLYQDQSIIAWWVPPARRQIWFRCDAALMGAGERGEVVPHPGLVFAVSAHRCWRVWAVKGAERPQPDTPMCRAPYFNVWENGRVCTGNVDVPGATTADRIAGWNAAFFDSWFTHPNIQKDLVQYRGGAYRFWRDMLDGRHHEFPERVLVPTGKTLAALLKEGGRDGD